MATDNELNRAEKIPFPHRQKTNMVFVSLIIQTNIKIWLHL
jgi:hypothetical protein